MNINYTFSQLYGGGTTSDPLIASTPYTFTITNNSGSSYLVLEAILPQNLESTISSPTNIANTIQTKYIIGFVLPTGTNSFIYTPLNSGEIKLRGTGGITLNIQD